jgi:hypothetical protein
MLSYNVPDRVRLAFDAPRGGRLHRPSQTAATRNVFEYYATSLKFETPVCASWQEFSF